MPSAKVADGHFDKITAAIHLDDIDDCKKHEIQLFKMLAERRENLEDELLKRLEELKTICVREGELTGELPLEIYKTLMPGEMEPKIKRRVGTTFKFSEQVFQTHSAAKNNDNSNNDEDATVQLEADIELHKKIVAAAERLAKDKSTNKSVRKKRRKDWQAASQRLKGLEKGLYKLRISNSKPDVSSNFDTISCGNVGSGFSLNNLKGWPNITGHSVKMPAKSCPSTPRGSLRDLSVFEGKILRNTECCHQPSTSAELKKSTTTLNSVSSTTPNVASSPKISTKAKLIKTLSPRLRSSSSSPASLTPTSCTSGAKTMVATPTSNSVKLLDDGGTLPPVVPNRRLPPFPPSQSSTVRMEPLATSSSSFPLSSNSHNRLTSACGPDVTDGHDPLHSQLYYEPPLYANIGYASSVPYKSVYRQVNFPTFQDKRRLNLASDRRENFANSSSLFTRFSVEKAANNDGCAIEPSFSSSGRDASVIDVDALAARFANFTQQISSTANSTRQTPQMLHYQHQLQQNQRCSTSSQSSSISIGSMSSTSSSAYSSSGYNSLTNAASNSQLLLHSNSNNNFPSSSLIVGGKSGADSVDGEGLREEECNHLKVSAPKAYSAVGGAFSTTSLDRRAIGGGVRGGGGLSLSSVLAASIYDNFHPNSQNNGQHEPYEASRNFPARNNNLMTTTFPVNDYYRPLEMSDFSKFRSNSSVMTPSKLDSREFPSTIKRSCVSAREFPRFHTTSTTFAAAIPQRKSNNGNNNSNKQGSVQSSLHLSHTNQNSWNFYASSSNPNPSSTTFQTYKSIRE